MDDSTLNIKEEFDNTIKTLEENDKKRSKILGTTLVVVAVMLFLATLAGTILSYSNYVKYKNKTNKVQVIELKSMN